MIQERLIHKWHIEMIAHKKENGRTDAEAEKYFGHLMQRTDSFERP